MCDGEGSQDLQYKRQRYYVDDSNTRDAFFVLPQWLTRCH